MTGVTRSSPSIDVVLPLFNEAAILRSLTSKLKETLSSLTMDWRILFVNDGSTDGSTELLDHLAREDSRLHAIHLTRNFGHTAAVRAGLD